MSSRKRSASQITATPDEATPTSPPKRVKRASQAAPVENGVAEPQALPKTYFECPEEYFGDDSLSMFLGGGISGCPNWQAQVRERMTASCPQMVLFNPRRSTFNVGDQGQSELQIQWEYKYLRRAKLGQWSVLSKQTNTKIIVGTHPEYKRKTDVEIQSSLVNPDIMVVDSLEKLCGLVENWYSQAVQQRAAACSIQ